MNCTNEVCEIRFKNIEQKLDDSDRKMFTLDTETGSQGKEIAVLQTIVTTLTKSMDGLSKAIWGACGTGLVFGIGFIIWYIQKG